MEKSASVIFRCPPELKENLQQLAAQQQRSVGGQIRLILEKAFAALPSELSR